MVSPVLTPTRQFFPPGFNAAASRNVVTGAKTMVNGDVIFNIIGDIEIVSLVSECETSGTSVASTIQYKSNPTVGAAATFTGTSTGLGSAVAGSSLSVLSGQTTAPSLVISGANNDSTYPLAAWCPEGTISLVVGVGSTTGTWRHYLRYNPLTDGSYVTANQ